MRKGILLAGGKATRLYPVTKCVSKHLLPVYNKPVIYYSLSLLMLSGIKEVLIITSIEYINDFRLLFGNGDEYGVKIDYIIQDKPNGLPEAFILAEEWLDGSESCLVLGDNILYGNDLSIILQKCNASKQSTILACYNKTPERYGVIELDSKSGKIISIEEKPKIPKSNYIIPGIYFFDKNAPKFAKQLTPSSRGELEITDLINIYNNNAKLNIEIFGRGVAWFDVGNFDNLLDAANFIAAIERNQGVTIGSPSDIINTY
jgi:glucose-1-phosphate thymidylyltransferase